MVRSFGQVFFFVGRRIEQMVVTQRSRYVDSDATHLEKLVGWPFRRGLVGAYSYMRHTIAQSISCRRLTIFGSSSRSVARSCRVRLTFFPNVYLHSITHVL